MNLPTSTPLLVAFTAGDTGPWRIDRIETRLDNTTATILETIPETIPDALTEGPLPMAPRLHIAEAPQLPVSGLWTLRGTTSNTRYSTHAEAAMLRARQEPLGRAEATCAALIPIRKSPAWWALAQDRRRALFEEQSHHTAIGLDYLPQIARRLHHARDLGEPFDFLTWFEFAPEQTSAFDTLLARLRATPEWTYVDREIDIRLTRADD